MPGPFGPVIPEAQRPTPGDVSFDLDNALAAVLSLRAKVPDDAFTARTLGTAEDRASMWGLQGAGRARIT